MSLKFFIFSCLVCVALAGNYHYLAPHPPAEKPANYQFQYEVHEESTGDIKRQREEAHDGKISGEYSLVEPDGDFRRIVTYTADDEHGFQAEVRREPWNQAKAHPKPAQPIIIKKLIAPAYGYQAW